MQNTEKTKEEVTQSEPALKKRGRGRPKRDGTTPSTPKKKVEGDDTTPINDETITTRNVIIDPILSPYKIYASDIQYVVVDEIRPEGSITDIVHGYFVSLDNALLKVVKLKMVKNKSFTLKEYMNEFKRMIDEFKLLFDKQ